MKRFLILTLLVFQMTALMLAADDNIHIVSRNVTCNLYSTDGLVSKAKMTDLYEFEARRVSETGMVAKFYDCNSVIDNADAPGSKPIYRAWENGDLFYSGTRVCLLPVEVKTGKRAKAKFTVSYKKPEYIDDIILNSPLYDTDRITVTVNIPSIAAERVTVEIFNGTGREKMTRDTDAKGNITVTVTSDSLKSFSSQPMMPDPMTCMPMVRINASFFDLDELYSYLRTTLEDSDARYPEITELAQSVAEEAGSDTLARIDAVAGWVRDNIRYVAIEHGELATRPDSAVSVLRKRFGDCKGSANLICAMLRSIGIDGRRVWIGTHGSVPAPFSKSPTLGGANHMIAAAVVGDSIIYLDGTVTHAPRGYVPQSIAGQECLIEDGDKFILTHVGEAYPQLSVMSQTGRLTIDGTRLGGTMRYGLSGAWRTMFESLTSSVTSSRRSRAIGIILANDRKSITVDSIEQTRGADTSAIVARVTDSEGVKAVAGRSKLYVMPRLLRMSQPSSVDARNRRFDIDNYYWLPVEADVTIEIPEGYETKGLPQTATIDNPWFYGMVSYTDCGDGTVRCRGYLYGRRTGARCDEAEAWNDAVRQVESASNTALVLTRKAE